MASISLKSISKSFDETRVLQKVNLEIADGEFLVLVGPSGCGKSTLLRCLAGLETITGGELLIGDTLMNDVEPRDRGVAMVFQSYALYPHMTVGENMAFALKIRKQPAELIERRLNEVAELLGLTEYLDRYPKQLSGGQRQRVAMGRAIVRQPDAFLFDEPLSNLDAALRAQMRVELKKLHARLNTTMVYVTHDQIEAMTLADRIAVLNAGILQQVGSPEELFQRPVNRFVARFIGSPAMNILPGTLQADGSFAGQGFTIPADVVPTHAKPIEMGIRPQHLYVQGSDEAGLIEGTTLSGHLDVIEPMGWEAYAHIRIADHVITAHVRTESLANYRAGDAIEVIVEPRRLHFFDVDGLRLAPHVETHETIQKLPGTSERSPLVDGQV